MKKPTVAVVFGSRSTEHDISVITAILAVINPLNLTKKYNVLPVYITKDGRWFGGQKFGDINFYTSHKIVDALKKEKPMSLLFDNGLTLINNNGIKQKKIKIDIVFPATHGAHGEDGELMAICEMARVPYVGCDVESSVIAMDKILAKQTVEANGIDITKYVAFNKASYELDPEKWQNKINNELRYPLFVKPAHLGSSIGIARVADKKELANAIEVALHYDTRALVEEGVNNLIEVTLPIMGNEEDLTPSLLEEPMLKDDDFFGFETKYIHGGKGGKKGGGKLGAQGYSRVPANIPQDLYKKAEQVALNSYKTIGCSGISRIDLLIDAKTKTVYFNEANPLPGSLYGHNWNKSGVSNIQLVEKLIEYAFKRFEKKEKIETVFESSFLKQF